MSKKVSKVVRDIVTEVRLLAQPQVPEDYVKAALPTIADRQESVLSQIPTEATL